MDIAKHVKTKLLAGLFILVPAIITIYIIYVVVSSLDALIYPVIRRAAWPIMGREMFIPGTGLLLLFIIV